MSGVDNTFELPYYAVIFTSERTLGDNGYNKMAEAMVNLAKKQPGFFGVESARDSESGNTVSYWKSLQNIENWKRNSAHLIAQERGIFKILLTNQ